MKDPIRISYPYILFIQETKMEKQDFLQTSAKFWKKGEGIAASARGASGGIGTLWDSIKFDILDSAT